MKIKAAEIYCNAKSVYQKVDAVYYDAHSTIDKKLKLAVDFLSDYHVAKVIIAGSVIGFIITLLDDRLNEELLILTIIPLTLGCGVKVLQNVYEEEDSKVLNQIFSILKMITEYTARINLSKNLCVTILEFLQPDQGAVLDSNLASWLSKLLSSTCAGVLNNLINYLQEKVSDWRYERDRANFKNSEKYAVKKIFFDILQNTIFDIFPEPVYFVLMLIINDMFWSPKKNNHLHDVVISAVKKSFINWTYNDIAGPVLEFENATIRAAIKTTFLIKMSTLWNEGRSKLEDYISEHVNKLDDLAAELIL